MKKMIVMVAVLAAIPLSSLSQTEQPEESVGTGLRDAMSKAAGEFASVRAQQKTIQALEHQRRATLLNQAGLIASINRSEQRGDLTVLGQTLPNDSTTRVSSLALQFQTSLAIYFQARGISLSRQTQEAALKALQIQLSVQAAQAYLEFTLFDQRDNYLNEILADLLNLKEAVDRGVMKISGQNRSLLLKSINDTQIALKQVGLNRETASAELEKFLGHAPVSTVRLRGSHTSSIRDTSAERYERTVQILNRLFPVPPTPEEAFKTALTSPALVQADLAEKSAQNTWYLTLAGYGPTVMVQVGKSITSTSATALAPATAIKGPSILAGLQMTIGGGALSNLSAANLMTEASQLSKEAAAKEVKASIQKLYPTLESLHEQMRLALGTLGQLASSLGGANPDSDQRFTEFLQILAGIDGAAQAAAQAEVSFVMTRIQLHALMGTLLEEAGMPQTQGTK